MQQLHPHPWHAHQRGFECTVSVHCTHRGGTGERSAACVCEWGCCLHVGVHTEHCCAATCKHKRFCAACKWTRVQMPAACKWPAGKYWAPLCNARGWRHASVHHQYGLVHAQVRVQERTHTGSVCVCVCACGFAHTMRARGDVCIRCASKCVHCECACAQVHKKCVQEVCIHACAHVSVQACACTGSTLTLQHCGCANASVCMNRAKAEGNCARKGGVQRCA